MPTTYTCAVCDRTGDHRAVRLCKTPLLNELFGGDASGPKQRLCSAHGSWPRKTNLTKRTEVYHSQVRKERPEMWATLVQLSREAGHAVRTAQLPRA